MGFRRWPLAIGEAVILLLPPSPFSRRFTVVERGCQQNESLATGHRARLGLWRINGSTFLAMSESAARARPGREQHL